MFMAMTRIARQVALAETALVTYLYHHEYRGRHDLAHPCRCCRKREKSTATGARQRLFVHREDDVLLQPVAALPGFRVRQQLYRQLFFALDR